MEPEKKCTKCGETKPLSEFYVNANKRTGYNPECKDCSKALSSEYRKKNKDKVLADKAIYRANNPHKISEYNQKASMERTKWNSKDTRYDEATYNRILTEQNGCCKICKQEKKPLIVDRESSTGDIRGIICRTCLNGLRNFFDNADFLKAAIEFIQRGNDNV